MLPSAFRGMEDCHHWPEAGIDEYVLVGIDEYDPIMEKWRTTLRAKKGLAGVTVL